MKKIISKNAFLRFPLIGNNSLSLKKRVIQSVSGNFINFAKNDKTLTALNDINLTLTSSDRVGVIGLNGSGKSSLLRLLSGIYHPTSGTVSINGKVTSLIDPSIGVDEFATGLENIQLRYLLLGLDKKGLKKFIQSVDKLSGLGIYLDRPIHTYSSGMKMRLFFAMSIAIKPDILIIDEWLSVTDRTFQLKAEKLMRDFVKNTNLLILASHDLSLIESLCSKTIYLKKGNIVFFGETRKAVTKYLNDIG